MRTPATSTRGVAPGATRTDAMPAARTSAQSPSPATPRATSHRYRRRDSAWRARCSAGMGHLLQRLAALWVQSGHAARELAEGDVTIGLHERPHLGRGA